MNYLILILFSIISLSSFGQDNTLAYRKRLDIIKTFKATIPDKEKELSDLISSIDSYEHKNMLPIDKKTLKEAKDSLENQLKTVSHSSGSLFVGSVEKKIKKLDELIEYKVSYEKKQARLKEIKNSPGLSKRFLKFIEATDGKKYTKADILQKVLFKEEKTLANEFDELNSFLIRESNFYKHNFDEIKEQKQSLEKTITYPENAMDKIDNALLKQQEDKETFLAVKGDHKKVQFDVTIGEWESGLFNCKENSNAKLMRYKAFPDLFALTTNGDVRSILNISPNKPNSKDFVYKCSDFSMFGSCLENTKKEICKIQDECATALEKMEISFKNENEFKNRKNAYLNQLSNERAEYNNRDNAFDILDAWDEDGRLGALPREKYESMFQEMFEYANKTDFSSSQDLAKKMKSKINKQKAVLLKKYKGDEDTYKALEYSHNKMIGFFDKMTDVDKFQEYVANNCSSGEFCTNYKNWLKAASVFEQLEEVENLTEEECPRIVLRFDGNNQIKSSYTCDRPKNNSDIEKMNSLSNESQKILKQVK